MYRSYLGAVGIQITASASCLCAQETRTRERNDVNEHAEHNEPLPADVAEVMRFAERYPSIPLHTLVDEVRHAQNTIESGANDRTQIIDAIITTRLTAYDAIEPG